MKPSTQHAVANLIIGNRQAQQYINYTSAKG